MRLYCNRALNKKASRLRVAPSLRKELEARKACCGQGSAGGISCQASAASSVLHFRLEFPAFAIFGDVAGGEGLIGITSARQLHGPLVRAQQGSTGVLLAQQGRALAVDGQRISVPRSPRTCPDSQTRPAPGARRGVSPASGPRAAGSRTLHYPHRTARRRGWRCGSCRRRCCSGQR